MAKRKKTGRAARRMAKHGQSAKVKKRTKSKAKAREKKRQEKAKRKQAWEKSNARREIRSIACSKPQNDLADCPPFSSWGTAHKVQQISIDIQFNPPLVSTASGSAKGVPEPSTLDERDRAVDRIRQVIELLSSGVPFGPILGFRSCPEWEQWIAVKGSGGGRKIGGDFTSTKNRLHVERAIQEIEDLLHILLTQGTSVELHQRSGKPSPKFKQASKQAVQWIVIPRVSVRFILKPGSARVSHHEDKT